MTEQKITPCLWFDAKTDEAFAHYLSITKLDVAKIERAFGPN